MVVRSVPVERKRALGNPGKRALPDSSRVVALAPVVDVVPDSLGVEGRRFWVSAVEAGRPWLAESDQHLLLLTAQAFDRRAFFLSQLAEQGWSIVTDKGYPYKNPLVQALADLEKQIGSWLSLLGLTPSDRSKLGVAEVKAQSKLEEMQAARDKRARG
mgnify:CR=1 FL=1